MKSHQQLGEDMNLFHQDSHAPGMVLWHPNGSRLLRSLADYTRNAYEASGFEEVQTPQLMKQSLWKISGHLDHYKENMFLVDGMDAESSYAIKPMGCPGHILLYKRSLQTAKTLPLRLFEFSNVHRNEPSGALNGLFRLRQFTQDDAHVFCTWDQINSEVADFILRAKAIYSAYGLDDVSFKLSTRPLNAFGDEDTWKKAENTLAQALRESGISFEVQAGEGAFYGPKIEITLKDSLKREWQCGTIQLDFNLPERFKLSYRDGEDKSTRPVILHQAMYGSLERWIGIMLETYQTLPEWIHPQPIAILPLSDTALDSAKQLQAICEDSGIHASVDESRATLGRKVKRAHRTRAVYTCIIGAQEISNAEVTMRRQSDGSQFIVPLSGVSAWIRESFQ